MEYSLGFKESVLRRLLPPENKRVTTVSKETGISRSTIRGWILQQKKGTLYGTRALEKSPSQRSGVEKFRLLLDSKRLNEDQIGEWLRRQGLHTEHLSLWEQELENILTNKEKELKKENCDLKKENHGLKKELVRKQAAMAEALALLTLKKKADALFNREEEL